MHAESISNTTVRVHVKNPMRCDESDEISIYLLPLLSVDVLDGMNYMLHNYIYDAQLPMRRPHTATMETNKDNMTTTTTTRNVRSTAATTTTSTPTARMKFSRSERGGGVTNRDEERDRAREGFVVLNGWANLFMTMALGKPSTRRTPWSMEPQAILPKMAVVNNFAGEFFFFCVLLCRGDGRTGNPSLPNT